MMKKVLSVVLCLLAVATAVFGVWLALSNRQAETVLVKEDPEARKAAQTLLDAVSAGDYAKAEGLLLGSPDLGLDRKAADALGKLLWDAYQENLTFTAVGDCYPTTSGVAYDYRVRRLDLDSVTANLRDRSQTLLAKRVEEAEDMDQVYDENNEYRESFVMAVLLEAAEQALVEDATYVELDFTVSMVYSGEKWLAIPDRGLLAAISGSLAN